MTLSEQGIGSSLSAAFDQLLAASVRTYACYMVGGRRLREARRWSEDCRVMQHRACTHVGTAQTVGLLSYRRFVTICPCPCHWGCPAELVVLPDVAKVCDCPALREERQLNFETAVRPSALRRLLGIGS